MIYLARYHRGDLSPEQGEDLLDRAAATAIAEQRELGLNEWTGGEYFTDNFIGHMQRVLHGLAAAGCPHVQLDVPVFGGELAAGIVDEASYGIETVKKIRDRAADWARVVGEERL